MVRDEFIILVMKGTSSFAPSFKSHVGRRSNSHDLDGEAMINLRISSVFAGSKLSAEAFSPCNVQTWRCARVFRQRPIGFLIEAPADGCDFVLEEGTELI